MPPPATSMRPGLARTAPVNAPFSWPNSSDSRRFSGSEAQSTGTNAWAARGLLAWTARAISSLPVPDSPRTRMLASERAAFFTSSNTWAMAGLRPTTFSSAKVVCSCSRRLRFSSASRRWRKARSTTRVSWSTEKFLGR